MVKTCRYKIVLLPAMICILVLPVAGCDRDRTQIGRLEKIWGRCGISDGRLQKPRAMAIDDKDRLFIVDMTARIQAFDPEGKFLHGWSTPDHKVGKPTGISIAHNGNVLIADTHYFRVLVYSPRGKLLKTIGGIEGHEPGEFGLVTDVVEDSQGNLYVSEYGEYDRIQKLSPEGKFILQWGGHGRELGQFVRPQNLAIDSQDRIWVADACNHRIQVFDTEGKLLKFWGTEGSAPDQLYYPYDILLEPDGNILICEYGNNRVQRFTPEGESLGCWGVEGRKEGQLHNPWAIVRDSKGKVHVLDTNNHRVQRVRM